MWAASGRGTVIVAGRSTRSLAVILDIAQYKQLFDPDDGAPGWDAIDAALSNIYGRQKPGHWGASLPAVLGGPDPLDGLSAYESTEGGRRHLHYCTYGYSSLYYDENAVGKDFSRFGFEMTFRLATKSSAQEESSNWVWNLLQNVARYVFQSGKWFENHHYLDAKGPIRLNYPTKLVGLIFSADPQLGSIDTPHGRVEFLQAFGITQKELDALKSNTLTPAVLIDGHRRSNSLLITDLDRDDG